MNKHTAALLAQHFDTAFAAPNGIKKLRELILTLAMQGKLVPQDPSDPPASELLKEIEAEKKRLVKAGKIKAPKPLSPLTEDEKPYALPQGWEWVRLGDIGQTQTGTTPKSGDHSSYGKDIPFIKPADITANAVDYSNEALSFSGVEKYGRLAPAGSSLMVCIGTIGKTNIINRDCSFNQQINAISPYLPLFPQYLQQFLRSSFFQNECWNQSSSTTIAILNKGKWESIPVGIPPLSEQRRIVAKIDELMTRCDALEKLRTAQEEKRMAVHTAAMTQLLNIAQTEAHQRAKTFLADHFGELYTVKENVAELRKAILQLAVMGKLVPQDPSDPPASELLKEIEAEKKRLVKAGKIKAPKPLPPVSEEEKPYALPQGWEWVRLGALVTVQTGKKDVNEGHESGLYPFFSCASAPLKSNNFSFDCEALLLPGNGANVGQVTRYNGKFEAYQRTYILSDFLFDIASYLEKVLNARFLKSIEGKQYGSAINYIKIGNLTDLLVPLPPLAEQHRIVAKIDELMALCDSLDQQVDAATAKQNALLFAVMAAL